MIQLPLVVGKHPIQNLPGKQLLPRLSDLDGSMLDSTQFVHTFCVEQSICVDGIGPKALSIFHTLETIKIVSVIFISYVPFSLFTRKKQFDSVRLSLVCFFSSDFAGFQITILLWPNELNEAKMIYYMKSTRTNKYEVCCNHIQTLKTRTRTQIY